jgi:glycosyltransferase involved in cell wall biosynthesis
MKILFLTNRLPHADVVGGHRLIYQRMEQLKNRGHWIGIAALVMDENRQHLAQLQSQFNFAEAIPYQNPPFTRRLLNDYLNPILPAIFWKNHSSAMMQLVGNAVQQYQCDLVVAEFSEMGQYLYRNPYLSAVHKIVSCHRCLSDTFEKYIATKGVPLSIRLKSAIQLKRLQTYEFEMYNAMDHILTLTSEDRFTLLNAAPQLPISVVAPGIDITALNHVSEINKSTHPLLLMCGYFTDKSNRDAALWFIRSIWPVIKKQHPETKCQFVGKGIGSEMRQAAGKDSRIELITDVEDLRPYRKGATIFINPMRLGSGLRVKILEAMGSGLPVVTTSLGAAGLPAQNGINCFINDTPEGFANAISWLLTDTQLASRIGARAKHMTTQQYNVHASTSQLERIFSDTINSAQQAKTS